MDSSVAVLIPVYNDPLGLSRSLESLARADGDFHIVVVDDGARPPVVESVQGQTVIRRMRQGGIAAALNDGLDWIRQQGFDYVARLDSGDTCTPDRIRIQRAFLDANHDYGIVGSDVSFIDEQGTPLYRYGPPLTHAEICRELHYRPPFVHPAVMLRCQVLLEAGPYSTSHRGAEDYELFFRILRLAKGKNLPEVLTQAFLNPVGISLARRNELISSRFRLQIDNFSPLDIHSYVGIARTLALRILPRDFLHAVKCVARPPYRYELSRDDTR